MKTLFDSPALPEDVHLIKAPGVVGELRLVAREIHGLIAKGTKANEIVVTCRHPGHYRTLVREVFAEYATPLDDPTPTAVARCPAVAFLLAAWHVPDGGFAFSAVTAVLRSGWFQPHWPAVTDPELPLRAETLLRALGVPRDRGAYLASVAEWARAKPFPLEDEIAEDRRWQKRHELAQRCRPFLELFFAMWDGIPDAATVAEYVGRFLRFAEVCGVPHDEAAWRLFRTTLRDSADNSRLTRAEFGRLLRARAAVVNGPTEPLPRVPAVRFLPPEVARQTACEHLFLIGLGEGSFPDPDEDLEQERELFDHLTTCPSMGLHLSYPAVDAKGQSLLPASLLKTIEAKIKRTTFRSMPIEGYATSPPVAAAERRVQAALALARNEDVPAGRVPDAVLANMIAARTVARARFRSNEYGAYDGRLSHPAAIAEVRRRFHSESRISPTSLEAYVNCPFRFMLEKVLGLETHEDPSEEVEHTRRGSAVHRALARLHQTPLDRESYEPELARHLVDVVTESQVRAAGPVERKLWELEGRRLARIARHYPGQTDKFLAKWRDLNVPLRPHSVEPAIGVKAEETAIRWPDLVLERNGDRVLIGGRVDRIDAVTLEGEVGFWVIDYKTGRASNYTGKDVESLKKLQLPLYALAVERVLFAGEKSRPLGVAYWLITDTGPKVMLPNYRRPTAWYADRTEWEKFRDVLETWVMAIVERIRNGDFALAPRAEDCTSSCHYGPTCRIGISRSRDKEFGMPLPQVGGSTADD